MSSGLPPHLRTPPPPVWTVGPLACPLLPPEVPSSAPGSSHPFTKLPSSLPPARLIQPCTVHLSLRLPPPSVSLFASDQVISFSAPSAASFQPLGHPILFDWLPHLDLHGHQATIVSHWTIHPWGAGPASACFLPLICHPAFPLATSTKL